MRRTHRRIPLDLYVNKLINGVPFLARTKDLSRHGMYVHQLLEPSSPEHAHIAVEFALPGTEEVIWAEAEVVHRGSGGTGLRFRDLTPRQTHLIEGYITDAALAG